MRRGIRLVVPAIAAIATCTLAACTPRTDTGDDTGPEDTAETGIVDTGDTGGPLTCVPNHDWIIEVDEFIADPSLGITVTSTVNEPGSVVPVEVAGTDAGGGRRSWAFTEPTAHDTTWPIRIHALEGTWFEDTFPNATYYVGLDATETTFGVYRVDREGERLLLLGIASAEAGVTLLKYATPVVVFEFPLVLDKKWTNADIHANGTHEGTDYPANYGYLGTVTLQHTYDFDVDAAGSAEVPLGSFEVLRLRLHQEMKAVNSLYGVFGNEETTAFFYVTECMGLVARIRSEPGVDATTFDTATEYLRLGY